jgi:cytochrome P450
VESVADLTDPVLFADGPPYDVFARMREDTPLTWTDYGANGFWSLTRYEDIAPVAKDFETWSNAMRGGFIEEEGILPKEMESLVFQMMDPPEHDKHRALLQKVFTSRAVAAREPDIRATTNRLIDAALEQDSFDFVTDIAVELPLTVTANMLGVPHEDRRKLFHWTNQMADTSLGREGKLQMITELGGYLMELIAERRARPTDDLLTRMMDAELDERRKLLDDPTLIPGAVEEILRWHTPIIHLARTATHDTTLLDTAIAGGDKIVMWFASANRDPAFVTEPDVFDVSRSKPKHISFGAGRHFCLGNQLARLELVVALQEALKRLPDLELTGPVIRKPNNTFHWMVSMPVASEARPEP